MLSSADAEKLQVPLGIYSSRDESLEEASISRSRRFVYARPLTNATFYSTTRLSILSPRNHSRERMTANIGPACMVHLSWATLYTHGHRRFHGWAAARANLDDPENKREFESLYATAVKFFQKAQ